MVVPCLLAELRAEKGRVIYLPVLERSPEDVRTDALTQLMLDQDADDPFQLLATTVSRSPQPELRLQYADCSVQRETTRAPARSLFYCSNAIQTMPNSSPRRRCSTLNWNTLTSR